MTARRPFPPWVLALVLLFVATDAVASCGSAFCSVNTDWQALGLGVRRGWRLKVQFEYLDQDQLRQGRNAVAGAETEAEHQELRTINRNWLATADYGIDAHWGVSVTLPYLNRDHSHIHDPTGEAEHEAWHFSDLGDVRVQGRYQFGGASFARTSTGVTFGVKLPTGAFDETNDEGEVAERTLPPGTGTTDLLMGAYAIQRLPAGWGSLFGRLAAQIPVNERDGFRPGVRYHVDGGWNYPFAPKLDAILQAGAAYHTRDRGSDAEPEDSGLTSLSISPGLSIPITSGTRLYTVVQLPVYQHVNGVQLTYDAAWVAGVAVSF
jgi:hypothetical protein